VSGRQTLRRGARSLAFIAAIACVHPGCAQHIGKQAAQGAATELRRQAEARPEKPAHEAAENAVVGVVDALDDPAQRARIDSLIAQAVSAAATAAVEKATRQLVAELGSNGEGPLAVSIAKTGERAAAAAVGGVGSELSALAPECAGPDPLGCLEKRLQQTARSTAASFSAGVRETLGWQLLLVAFALGALGGMLGTWLWSLLHERQERRRASLRTA
jgi:hypothetical protein